MKTYNAWVENILSWMHHAKTAILESGLRPWCVLGEKKSITQDSLRKAFDRKELNRFYAANYKNPNPLTKEPISFVQQEVDLIYGLQKCMVARHKGRLMAYRDDAAQKGYHTRGAISLGLARYASQKDVKANSA